MINASQVMAFVATSDVIKARAFYGDKLGLVPVSQDDYALVFDAKGIMLRIQKVENVHPQGYTVLGWKVSDKCPYLAEEE